MKGRRIKPKRLERARELRRAMTLPERLLWSRLRRGELKFRTQAPIGPFFADFLCLHPKVIVEVDGLSHVGKLAEDRERENYLCGEGFRIIRVSNDAVLEDVDAVAAWIAREASS